MGQTADGAPEEGAGRQAMAEDQQAAVQVQEEPEPVPNTAEVMAEPMPEGGPTKVVPKPSPATPSSGSDCHDGGG